MVKGGCHIHFGSVSRLMCTWRKNHLHPLSSIYSVYYSSEHSSLLLLLSRPTGLSKTHGHRVTCLLKIRISSCRLAAAFVAAQSSTSFLLTLFNGQCYDSSVSQGNVSLDSDEAAGAADNSDVPAAAMSVFQARSLSSASGSSRSSAQVLHS